MNVPIHELLSVTTVCSSLDKWICWFSWAQRKGSHFRRLFLVNHCVVHQQALCTRVINCQYMMSDVQNIVKFIW